MQNSLEEIAYKPAERNEGISRRNFLRTAAGAGLALTGIGGLVGCALTPDLDVNFKIAGRDFNKYDFDAITREYETGKRQVIPINSIDDFALSGEELGWMRLSEGTEKRRRTSLFDSNPLKGNDDRFNLGRKMIENFPICQEWFLIQYQGRTNYPRYPFDIFVNKFSSEKEFFEATTKIKYLFSNLASLHKEVIESLEIPEKRSVKKYKEWSSKRKPYMGELIFFSQFPFIVGIDSYFHEDKNQKREHFSRMKLYQKKRGLDLVWSDFEQIQP
ncbi:MAG: twin-arginine translocation signal domain-containing protein [Candidatus Gracilibacteria bacterium]|nr:twin-arginine translocation signal domain-containing protein [Candidatus Gracilibacteria bacterium]